jgi:hypothetical protein
MTEETKDTAETVRVRVRHGVWSDEPKDVTATIRVEATAYGVYENIQRHVGHVFDLVPRSGRFTERVLDKDGEPALSQGTIRHRLTGEWINRYPVTREVEKVLTAAEQFNPKWMRRVPDNTPLT